MKNYLSFPIAVILIIILVIACSKSDKKIEQSKEKTSTGWTDSEKKIFMNDCTGGMDKSISKEKAKTYCECMMEKIMTKYTEYTDTYGKEKDEFREMIKECDKEAGIEGYD